ncbi:hypothetical protein AB0M54_09435 [Actinoplanes sp. NPDC051470]|uniref:hypothetical protein n=1 Tax=unclassified Actinoplanes TaxID=2626549 RepID=UPI00342C942F
MTTVDEQQSGFALRLAQAKVEPRREVARRTEVVLRVTAVTLAWLVTMALLLGWSLASPGPAGAERYAAALVAILLPFVAAVIAVSNHQGRLGGLYIVLTLVMVFPALGIAGWA